MVTYPFQFLDPGDQKPPASPNPGWADIVPSLAGKTAVVVEDEGVTQLQIKQALTRAGMKVVGVAADGPGAVEVVLRTRPEIVVLDIKMPGEYDGLEAARRILQTFKTCIIMLTAYHDFREEALQAGACGYVVKPVTFQTLVPEIKSASDRFYAA